MAAHKEIFEKMAVLLVGKQQMAVLGRRKADWEIIFKTGSAWDFAAGTLRQRVLKAAEGSSEPVVVMDSEKDDRFVDSKPPFRSAMCIPILVPGRLPVMVFAEDPEKLMAFEYHNLPAWKALVDELRTHVPELKAPSPKKVSSAKSSASEASEPKQSLMEKISQSINPENEKMEVNWPALVLVGVVLLGGMVYGIHSYLQSIKMDQLRKCETNLATIATAARMYARDHKGKYPKKLDLLVESKYLEVVPNCPAGRSMTYTDYVASDKGAAVTVSCVGGHHRQLFKGSGSPEAFPHYYSLEAQERPRPPKK